MKLKSKILPCVALTMLCALITPRSLAMFKVPRDEKSPEPPTNPSIFAPAPSGLFSTTPVVPTSRNSSTPKFPKSGTSSWDVRYRRTPRFEGEPYPLPTNRSDQIGWCTVDTFVPLLPCTTEIVSLQEAIIRKWDATAIALIETTEPDDLDKVDMNGNTALHLAVEHENLKIVQLLLTRGANVNAENNENQTPLTLARYIIKKKNSRNRENLMEIMECLEARGGRDPQTEKPRDINAYAPSAFWLGAFKL